MKKIMRRIQIINDASDVLRLSPGYNFGLKNLIKKISIIVIF